jgi:hypothetical protein
MFNIQVRFWKNKLNMEPDYSRPIYKNYSGRKISECMRQINDARQHHDCAKYTPMEIVGVEDTSE